MDRGRVKTSGFVILLAFCLASRVFADPFEPLEAVVRQARDFNDFLARPDLLGAYKAALQTYYGNQKFQCESFEGILANLRVLNQKVPGFGEALWRPQAPGRFVLYRAPEGLKSAGRERWELSEPPRKLHGVWNDPSRRGCVSEDCGKAEVTAPERWSTALPGSQVFLLHRQDRFQGTAVALLPVSRSNQNFSLVTVTGSGTLQAEATYSEEPTGYPAQTSLYNFLLDGLRRKSPGFDPVALEYDAKDPSIGRFVRLRPASPKENFAGFIDEIRPSAPMAAEISRAVPRKCFARRGVDPMNLFAGFNKAGASSSGPGAGVAMNSPETIRDLLVKVSNPENLSNVVNVTADQKPALGKTLAGLMAQDKDDTLREKAALALRLLDQFPTEDRRTFTPVKRSPASRSPASADSPGGRGARGSSPSFFSAFRGALGDSSPGVRAAAASALASQGDSSPEVKTELVRAMASPDKTPAGLSPGQVAAMAAQGKNRGGSGVAPDDVDNLMNRLSGEPDPKVRTQIMDELAKSFMKAKDGAPLREALAEKATEDPKAVNDVINHINDKGPEVCAAEREREAAILAEGAAAAAVGDGFIKPVGRVTPIGGLGSGVLDGFLEQKPEGK